MKKYIASIALVAVALCGCSQKPTVNQPDAPACNAPASDNGAVDGRMSRAQWDLLTPEQQSHIPAANRPL